MANWFDYGCYLLDECELLLSFHSHAYHPKSHKMISIGLIVRVSF